MMEVRDTSAPLIVAGFHRSGTSLTAQLLSRAGVFLGDEMLPSHRSNPHGHFEDREIVRFHDEILEDNGLTWQVAGPPFPIVEESHRRRIVEIIERREAGRGVWGFKDPRVCLFMDTWKSLLPDAKALLVYRSFAESSYSLHRRAANALLAGANPRDWHRRFWEAPDLALRMWLAHNRKLLDFARAHPEDVMAVSFDMLRNDFPLIKALNQRWGMGLEEVPTSEVFDPKATAAPRLKQPASDDKLIADALETWERLEHLGRETEESAGTSVGAGERAVEEVFYKPTDAYAPMMEKELMYFLRERFNEEEEAQKSVQAEMEEARKLSIPPQRRKELEKTEADMERIVKRMSGSRLAPIFRLKKGFRILEARYLK